MNRYLNKSEIFWLKYYIGDVGGSDVFFGDPEAYLVLNSLFYDGIFTEISRSAEGKHLNPHILDDVDRLLDFYDNLFSAFWKCRAEKPLRTYRVERMNDYIPIKNHGCTISFTSTSENGFLDSYRDRRGIALMKFEIAENIPCIDMEKNLDFYAKKYESEILLPPFMPLDISENHLTDYEKNITDSDGKSPEISSLAVCGDWILKKDRTENISREGSECGKLVYQALNNGEMPENRLIEIFVEWKKTLQNIYQKLL
ncbi:MAG: hypothetical protein K2J08_02720 [Ruminococcus sp.]|nr:hypothetical protein [Ruminococcus sp.]